MERLIETERFYLRELVMSDAPALFKMDSDPEVHKYLGGTPVQDISEIHTVIQYIQQQYVDLGIGRWAVIEKCTDTFVGWAGLKYIKNPLHLISNYYDLGYRLDRAFWGKGIATECTNALINYAIDVMQIGEIYAIADINNAASIRVLEKAGFIRTDTFEYDGDLHYWFELIFEF